MGDNNQFLDVFFRRCLAVFRKHGLIGLHVEGSFDIDGCHSMKLKRLSEVGLKPLGKFLLPTLSTFAMFFTIL